MKEWQCTGHNPTTWTLGDNNGGFMENVIASVKRLDNGKWLAKTENLSTVEPSRIEAMKSCELMIKED